MPGLATRHLDTSQTSQRPSAEFHVGLTPFPPFTHHRGQIRGRDTDPHAFDIKRRRLGRACRKNAKHSPIPPANFHCAIPLGLFQHGREVSSRFGVGIRLHRALTSRTYSFNSRARAFNPPSKLKIGARWFSAKASTYASYA